MASSIFIEYEHFLNWSIWPMHTTLTGTTTPGLVGLLVGFIAYQLFLGYLKLI